MQKRKRSKKKRKIFIEIKSNKNGWTKVQFLRSNNDGTILIKMPDGQIIKHKRQGTRTYVAKKISNAIPKGNKKQYRKRKKKKNKKRSKVNDMKKDLKELIKWKKNRGKLN